METRNSSPEDRISILQDTLIHHILSFLDMKFAVQTSILSRRWSHIWTSLPVLNFDSELYISPETFEVDGFVEFIDNVFILWNTCSDIQKLHLVSRGCEITRRLNTWIVAAVRGNVEDIYVDASYSGNLFSRCLFTSKSLNKLELKVGGCITLPNSIDLPRLKFLKLDSLWFKDETIVNKLFSSCPVIESLIVKGCMRRVNLYISSLTLQHLNLDNTYGRTNSKLTLYAPNLKSFVSSNLDYTLQNLSSLVTADIRMVEDGNVEMPEIYSKLPTGLRETYAQRMMKCLSALHNVKDLTLSTWLLGVVSGAPELFDSQPQLHNLQSLKLQTSLSSDAMHAITYILKISPKLESLFLVIKEGDTELPFRDVAMFNSENIEDYWEAGLPPACMLHHLKLVEISGVQACVSELRFLKILLKNAMVLEKVVLFRSSRYRGSLTRLEMLEGANSIGTKLMSLKKESDAKLNIFRQKLLMLPKASSSIAIFFLYT